MITGGRNFASSLFVAVVVVVLSSVTGVPTCVDATTAGAAIAMVHYLLQVDGWSLLALRQEIILPPNPM